MYFKGWKMVFCDELRSRVLLLLNLDALTNFRHHTFLVKMQIDRDYNLYFRIKRVKSGVWSLRSESR
jgi:hypothetical protein